MFPPAGVLSCGLSTTTDNGSLLFAVPSLLRISVQDRLSEASLGGRNTVHLKRFFDQEQEVSMSFLPMLHSVSYSGSWGQAALSLEQFVDRAADLGFSGVMLMAKRPHLSVLDWDAKARAQLRQQLERRKIERVCIAGYNNFTADLEHAEVPHREIQIQYITELARLAHDLGSGFVRIFTGYENPAGNYHAQWKLIVDALKESARRAHEFGVTLGIQNHHDIGVGYESFSDLIRAVDEPNCKAMFDAWAPPFMVTTSWQPRISWDHSPYRPRSRTISAVPVTITTRRS